MRTAPTIELAPSQRVRLRLWTAGADARRALRAKIVLLAADGMQNRAIAEALGVSRNTVGLWRARFAADGLSGVEKAAPRGRARSAAARYAQICEDPPRPASRPLARHSADPM